MLFQFNFYSSLLLIFFIHGLVYAILLWRKSIKNESMSDRWLSLFLFFCIIYIAPWMLGFAGWYDTQPYRDYLFYIPFQHLYFIGPVIFFYLQSLLNPSFRFSKKDWLHFVPGILYIIYSLVIVITDKLVLHEYYFLADGTDRDFDTWYQVSGFISMIFYFIASISYYNRYKKMVVQVVSYADTVLFRWVKNFLLAFLIILLVRSVFFALNFFFDMKYWDVWWYFLSFSILFYYIAITGYANSVTARVSFQFNVFNNKTPLLLNYTSSTGTVEEAEIVEESTVQVADEPLLKELKEKIMRIVEQDKIYEDPELTLPDLAKKLQTNVSVLSKTINQGFGMNFNDFINYYRVQAVIKMLKAGEQKKQTLLGIAFDCGFNSKATFNRAFKKVSSKSPKEFIEELPVS
jgi:AraC-like DNA-binding protein